MTWPPAKCWSILLLQCAYLCLIFKVILVCLELCYRMTRPKTLLGLDVDSIGPSIENPISPLKDLSHAACCPVLANSIYSASPTDNATGFCCWDAQDIALFAIKKTCPDVEWQSSLFSPQSESEYLINPALEALLYLDFSKWIPAGSGVLVSFASWSLNLFSAFSIYACWSIQMAQLFWSLVIQIPK